MYGSPFYVTKHNISEGFEKVVSKLKLVIFTLILNYTLAIGKQIAPYYNVQSVILDLAAILAAVAVTPAALYYLYTLWTKILTPLNNLQTLEKKDVKYKQLLEVTIYLLYITSALTVLGSIIGPIPGAFIGGNVFYFLSFAFTAVACNYLYTFFVTCKKDQRIVEVPNNNLAFGYAILGVMQFIGFFYKTGDVAGYIAVFILVSICAIIGISTINKGSKSVADGFAMLEELKDTPHSRPKKPKIPAKPITEEKQFVSSNESYISISESKIEDWGEVKTRTYRDEEKPEERTCEVCGEELEREERFCGKCGAYNAG